MPSTSRDPKKLRKLLRNKEIIDCQRTLRVLCGRTRFQILVLLARKKTGLTVTDLAQALEASHSRVSHQLSLLRRHKIVRGKGQNRETVYRLSDGHVRRHLCF